MEIQAPGRDAFKLVVFPSGLASGLFSIVRFPGLTDESAVMFRICAAAVCICNLLAYRTSDAENRSSGFARLALFFHAGTCFLAAQGSLFSFVLWFAHAGLEIAYTWLYHCLTVRRKSPWPQVCFIMACLSCGGTLRLLRDVQVVETPAQHRRLEESDDASTSDYMGILIVTMVSVVIGSLIVYGACSLDRVNEHPALFYAMDALRTTSALISRSSRSYRDCLMQCFRKARVEAYANEEDSVGEDVPPERFARDLLSTLVASTCRNQRDLTHHVRYARVVSMLRVALDEEVHSQDGAGELVLPNMTHLVSPDEEDEAPANVHDIMVSFVEPAVIGRSSMDAQVEHRVGQTNQEQLFELGVLPVADDVVDDVPQRDPMAALEEREHGLYHAQSAITFSECESFSENSGSSYYSGSAEQSWNRTVDFD
eukprot:TRINITY_DN4423_c0_g2_i2.p1 TRINITY_DN4423_c0_g2~~TRINITY_DN4423_c0_g2_i2.p1  ORF type:complete len:426 (-),score=40.49 TRINITY_DN4423_c0_g2_i2:419-1696(-)